MPDMQDIVPLIVLVPLGLLFLAGVFGVVFYEQDRRRNNDFRVVRNRELSSLVLGDKPVVKDD